MKVATLTRKFRYNGTDLMDPNPSMTPEQVCKMYAGQFPELNNAAIEGPTTKNGESVYTFARAVGSKGYATSDLRQKLQEAAKGTNAQVKAKKKKQQHFAQIIQSVVSTQTPAIALTQPATAFGLWG